MSSLHPVLRQDFLEMIRPEILMKVLMTNSTYCRRHGLVESNNASDTLWQEHVTILLSVTDSEVPSLLMRTLAEIQDLAVEDAVDALVADICAEIKQPWPPGWPTQLSHAEIAVLSYLDYYKRFRHHYLLFKPRLPTHFVEYLGDKIDPSTFQPNDADRQKRFTHVLSHFFKKRQRSGFCRLRVSGSSTETRWIISHGQTEHHQSIVASDHDYQNLVFRPIRHDTIILCSITGRLLINAHYNCEADQYRKLIGELYFDCSEYFSGESVYSLAPLRAQGAAALLCSDIPQLSKVQLRQIEMHTAQVGRIKSYKDQNLDDCLAKRSVQKALELNKVLRIRLACFVEHQTHPLMVHIKPPNEARLEPRPGYEIVTRFLMSRGFLTLKPVARQQQLFKMSMLGG